MSGRRDFFGIVCNLVHWIFEDLLYSCSFSAAIHYSGCRVACPLVMRRFLNMVATTPFCLLVF